MKFHDELNPVIWDKDNNNAMRPEVLAKLNEIADAFIEFIEIPEDAILDKVVTGSSASYNYNEYSDLDLHIIVDYDKIHEDCPLVEGYLGALKNTFNKEHDITIHGVPVELYAEKKDQGTIHNGLYSVQQEEWIDEPRKIPPTKNDAAVEAKYNEIKNMVDKCDDSEEANELLEKIYKMRKAGLAEVGEFSTENLAFKKLRNAGCMDKLRQLKKEKIDKQLSLESYNESENLSTNWTNYCIIVSAEDGHWLRKHGVFNSSEEADNYIQDAIKKGIRNSENWEYSQLSKQDIIDLGLQKKLNVTVKDESIKEELTDDQLLSGAKFMMQGYGAKMIEPGEYVVSIFDSQEEDAPVDGRENYVYPTLDKALKAYNKFIKKYAKVILKKYIGNGYKIIKEQDNPTTFNRTYKYSSPEAFKKSLEQFRKDPDYEVEDVIEDKNLLHLVYKITNGNKEHVCTFNNTTLERYWDIIFKNESIKEDKKVWYELYLPSEEATDGDRFKDKEFYEEYPTLIEARKAAKDAMKEFGYEKFFLYKMSPDWKREQYCDTLTLEMFDESFNDIKDVFRTHSFNTVEETEEIARELDKLPKGTKLEYRLDNSWHECIEFYIKTDVNKTFDDAKTNWTYVYTVDGNEVRRKGLSSFDVASSIKAYNDIDRLIVMESETKRDIIESVDSLTKELKSLLEE